MGHIYNNSTLLYDLKSTRPGGVMPLIPAEQEEAEFKASLICVVSSGQSVLGHKTLSEKQNERTNEKLDNSVFSTELFPFSFHSSQNAFLWIWNLGRLRVFSSRESFLVLTEPVSDVCAV